MTASTVFRSALIAFVLGVALGTFSYQAAVSAALLVAASGIAAFGAFPDRRGAVLLFLSLTCSAGWLHAGKEAAYWRAISDTGDSSGLVEIVRKPEEKDFFRDAVVRFRSCASGTCPGDRVLVRFPLSTPVSFGDVGTLSCHFSVPEDPWRMYHAKDGISHVCRKPDWERTETGNGPTVALMRLSDRFETALSRVLPEPESSLASGILLGGEGRLQTDTKEDFRAAGLAHIVAVSGYNVSIIAGYLLLLGIALFMPRRKAAVFAFFGTLAFVFVSGAPPSAVRAIGMSSTLILAWILGRRYVSFHALLFAAAVMLAIDPLIIRHDIGFLLSFAATAGIILATPFIGRFLRGAPSFAGVFLEAFFLTVAAEILILPIVFSNFGHFSFAAFPANAALLPLVPIAMLFSFLAGVAGMISETLGSIFGFPAYAFLHAIVSGAGYAASFERLDIAWDTFGWTEAAVWYAVIGVVSVIVRRRIRRCDFPSERGTGIMSL